MRKWPTALLASVKEATPTPRNLVTRVNATPGRLGPDGNSTNWSKCDELKIGGGFQVWMHCTLWWRLAQPQSSMPHGWRVSGSEGGHGHLQHDALPRLGRLESLVRLHGELWWRPEGTHPLLPHAQGVQSWRGLRGRHHLRRWQMPHLVRLGRVARMQVIFFVYFQCWKMKMICAKPLIL